MGKMAAADPVLQFLSMFWPKTKPRSNQVRQSYDRRFTNYYGEISRIGNDELLDNILIIKSLPCLREHVELNPKDLIRNYLTEFLRTSESSLLYLERFHSSLIGIVGLESSVEALAWGSICQVLTSLKRVEQHSSDVKLESHSLVAMRNPREQKQANGLMTKLNELGTLARRENLPCFHVPGTANERFLFREDLLHEIAMKLDPPAGSQSPSIRSLALYGIGGAGKTQMALQYACRSREKFDAVLCISADQHSKIAESFLEVSLHLGLTSKESKHLDATEAMTMTKRWLSDTRCSWLLIFDNADDLGVLAKGWPGAASGSILITTRDSGTGLHPASNGLHIPSLDPDQSIVAFAKILGHEFEDAKSLEMASEVTQILGGLPLALNQIGSYIRQRRLSLEDFLKQYKKHQKRIHAQKVSAFDYSDTIATIWSLSLEKLPENSTALLRLISFFDPDEISEEAPELEFIQNDFDFPDAQEPLFRCALLGKDPATRNLSLHKLVQTAILHDLNDEDKLRYLQDSIKLMIKVFPAAWADVTDGYTYSKWDLCRRCLPHVVHLSNYLSGESLGESTVGSFISLLLRCAWYLYESEEYADGTGMIDTCLSLATRHSLRETLQCAAVLNVKGLIEIDLGNPAAAVGYLQEGLRLRQSLYTDPNNWGIASSMSNVEIAYMEMGETDLAMEHHCRALEFRKRIRFKRLDNFYFNLAALRVRMGKPNEAESMYRQVPGIRDLTDADLLNHDQPRAASGLQVLSMIREQQGRIEDSLSLAIKVLDFRRGKFGGRFKTCDSLCRVGNLFLKLNQPIAALKVLQEGIFNASSLRLGEGYSALAHFRTHVAYGQLGKRKEAEAHLKAAMAAREIVLARTKSLDCILDTTEKAFEQLVAFVLW
ncbi:hypothetical protein DSL72_008039 [Monilinia vaccinii-corymbosi]|uniref:NB-ARC domain-containing protein n=1 Tax=Monilinia vaccinii-corymbosi TaxID=61207 RepID=A0A8A3PIQ9_9HELO|nr:hypothetical protein DSL72_008039 [Monilinia vaccinii-corymbosi]